MNIKEFAAFAAEELPRYLTGEEEKQIRIELSEVLKLNDQALYGLTFQNGKEPSPTYYLNEMYDAFCAGTEPDALLRHLTAAYRENRLTGPTPEEIPDLSFRKIRRRTGLRLLGMEYNREFLKTVPYREVGNGYALICDVSIRASDGGQFSTIVTNTMAEDYEYDIPRLFDLAKENCRESNPASLTPASDLLFGGDWGEEKDTCYILTTKRQHYGAAALFYPGTQAMVAHVLREDYLAIPSSLHEFIILRASRVMEPQRLIGLVKQANRTFVRLDEVLSDNILRYSQSTGSLSLLEQDECRPAAALS